MVSFISVVVWLASFGWALASIYRWNYLYHDASQMLLGVLIGLLGMFFAYLYGWMRMMEKKYTALLEWWTKQRLDEDG